MAIGESLIVCAQTVISNGAGASVGLESGYAQIGGAIASRLGLALRLRRQDLRLLVGCGAGGAIAAAFGAPLTGAFYASELIIGAYSLANAGPIFAAALAATLTTKALLGAPYVIVAPPVAALTLGDHFVLVALGLISAAIGVGAMRAAALLERGFAATRAPRWARPGARRPHPGGDGAATRRKCSAPDTARSGSTSQPSCPPATLATLLALKLSASLISLASGFRGGLFFASLFAGALLGKLYALGVAAALPRLGLDPTACIMAGMGTLSVAVVGGPLTMTFLVLESTGDLGVAGGVLAASIATSLAVRATFGYSFTTWRLHLRGESIRGAQDVGWLRDLTVGRLMVERAADDSGRDVGARLPRRLSARQRPCRRRGRRSGTLQRTCAGARSARRAAGRRRRRRPDFSRRAAAGNEPASRRRRADGAGDFRRRADRYAGRDRARNRRRHRPARRGLRGAPLRPGNRPGGEGRLGRRVGAGGDARRQPQAPVSSSGVKSLVKFCQVLSSLVKGCQAFA